VAVRRPAEGSQGTAAVKAGAHWAGAGEGGAHVVGAKTHIVEAAGLQIEQPGDQLPLQAPIIRGADLSGERQQAIANLGLHDLGCRYCCHFFLLWPGWRAVEPQATVKSIPVACIMQAECILA
jgi:hypothetical protein